MESVMTVGKRQWGEGVENYPEMPEANYEKNIKWFALDLKYVFKGISHKPL